MQVHPFFLVALRNFPYFPLLLLDE